MTSTIRHHATPDAIKGKYIVSRSWNSCGGTDFLHAWDESHGAVFTGIGGAMAFDDKLEAVRAAVKAKHLVPHTMGGAHLVYDVHVAA